MSQVIPYRVCKRGAEFAFWRGVSDTVCQFGRGAAIDAKPPFTPELDDARKEMRKYTTWGKTSLMDTDWTEVQEGHEAEYNFFKVSVEMR